MLLGVKKIPYSVVKTGNKRAVSLAVNKRWLAECNFFAGKDTKNQPNKQNLSLIALFLLQDNWPIRVFS